MHSQTYTQNYRDRGSLEGSYKNIFQVYLFKIKIYNLVFVSIRIQHVCIFLFLFLILFYFFIFFIFKLYKIVLISTLI